MSPVKHATEALLRARFGPEAIINRVGAIWMVHVDQPSKAEIQEREAELQQELLEPDEYGCCDLMRPQAGDTLIYDEVMCLIEPAPWRKLFPDLDEGEPDRRPQAHAS
ncbi:MAG: hypothetical protein Q8R91_05915 [Candidatus Omnitrophota bacterium]|nr:hypothetical protein [Candidatus Omnitrophota bacterium]